MPDADKNPLKDAIARNAGLVLSLPSAGMLRHSKSRFLGESDEGFWIESNPAERVLIEALVVSQQPVGISFKSGVNKVIFTTPLIRGQPYRVNASVVVEGLLLKRPDPDKVKAIQRRSNYRVAVPRDAEVTVRMWRIPERAYLRDRPMAAQEVQVHIRDLSLGGMGCTLFGKDGQPPVITNEDRLRIQIAAREHSLLVEGRMRHPVGKPKTDVVRAGIQFKALENSLEGRQTLNTLTRVIGELAREEVRRLRLGIKAA
jgi:c-di-GMP-binding flagellar brake protein YcgR